MLEGIRIVEIEGIGPGPFACMLMADLGADVIVVQRPGGNPTPGVSGESSLVNRGKRSIALDLKDPEDVATVRSIVRTADGLVEGFRPGVMERLGLGPEPCHAINPKLVYGRMTGWGQEGPLAHVAGHDLDYLSLSGALWYASLPGTPPLTPPTMLGDVGGGALYLVIGMLSGILRARQTGQGTVVDAAIYDGSAHMMGLITMLLRGSGRSSERGSFMLDGSHWSRTYRTRDGRHVSVQCLEPKFYAEFLRRLGLQESEAFEAQFDADRWRELTRRLEERFAEETLAYWVDVFEGSDACVAPVLSPDESFEHPMNAARETWHRVDGDLQVAPAPRFADEPAWTPRPAARRDEHRAEILAEID